MKLRESANPPTAAKQIYALHLPGPYRQKPFVRSVLTQINKTVGMKYFKRPPERRLLSDNPREKTSSHTANGGNLEISSQSRTHNAWYQNNSGTW